MNCGLLNTQFICFMEPQNQPLQQPLQQLHDFTGINKKLLTRTVIAVLIVALSLGVITGFVMSKGKIVGSAVIQNGQGGAVTVQKGAVIGSGDESVFKDTAEGILKKGGIGGEGAYHLVRPGGDSQNVYLTSSLVDLSVLIDRKIKVWGQTQKAQTAGWLMDVGKVQVLE